MAKWTSTIDATGDGANIFWVLGAARKLLRQIGDEASIEPLTAAVQSAPSYSAALNEVRQYFDLITDDD